ncbi:MAG: SMP-30/gluconolactonase/LRE family protein [Actinobacteria bacterium]|nr:SMP-30/gluconolactonase/LRE family protein [Actinomycetota bacterium]
MAFAKPHANVVLNDVSGRLKLLVSPDAKLERIASGLWFTEGPVWRGDHLLFSDIPSDRICRWRELPEGPELTTFRAWNGETNGLTLDKTGRLLGCAHKARAVLRFDAMNQPTPIATHYAGKRLNSPNDLIVTRAGDIYFTDPPYGIDDLPPQAKEQQDNAVYRLAPDGTLAQVATRFVRPNGLALSPDERTMYVGDSGGPRDIWAFDVQPDGELARPRKFVDMRQHPEQSNPDGMKVDTDGRLWSTGPGGIWVIEPDGTVLGQVGVPEVPANCAWGGADWSTLYITARSSVYRVRTNVKGVAVP